MKHKKQFKFFSILDHEKEQEYLRQMHKSGWKFTEVSGLCMYYFEECEPEDVIYQLDYNADGIEHKDEYVQMFIDCGWEYIQDYVRYSYFRKPASETGGNEEIFCDAESRLQMLQRVFRGRLIPLLILFLLVLFPQFIIQLINTVRYDMSPSLCVFLGAVILLYLIIFTGFAVKYYKYRKNVRK